MSTEVDTTESGNVSSLIDKSTEEIDELSNLIISLLTAVSQRDLTVVSSNPSEVSQKIAQIKTLMAQLTVRNHRFEWLDRPTGRFGETTDTRRRYHRIHREERSPETGIIIS